MPAQANDGAPRVCTSSFVAGLLFGAAAGVKLTAITYAPAAVCAVLVSVVPWRRSLVCVCVFSASWLVAFGGTYGWWGWLLWETTGNPLFPFYNAIFRSDWYPPTNFYDPYFKVDSLPKALIFPFYWIRRGFGVVTEIPFRDARFAIAYVAFFILAALGYRTRMSGRSSASDPNPTPNRAAAVVIVFVAVSYVTWLLKFAALRYATVIEALTGTLIVLALRSVTGLIWSDRRQTAAVTISGLLVLGTLLIHTQLPEWGRRAYADRVFSVDVPSMPSDSLVVLHHVPHAYVIPFITSPRFAAISVTWATIPPYHIYQETRRRIASHTGSIFILYNRVEPVIWRDRIADLGLTWDANDCRPVVSNISWGLMLCAALRR
jgi:hypothetical protein